MVKYSGYAKTLRKPSSMEVLSEGEMVKAPGGNSASHLLRCPGGPGRGAPVTERLRCLLFAGELGWYRDSRRPYAIRGGVFVFVYLVDS